MYRREVALLFCIILFFVSFSKPSFAELHTKRMKDTDHQINLVDKIEKNGNSFIVKYKNPPSYMASSIGSNSADFPIKMVKLNKSQDAEEVIKSHLLNSDVEYVEPNYRRQMAVNVNDPLVNNQWAFQSINMNATWDMNIQDEVIVAVIDSGIDFDHEDLQGKVIEGYNFINPNSKASDDTAFSHGTKVSGIISAITNNGKGIAGIANHVKIMPLKVLDEYGYGYDSDIIEAIIYAVNHNANVINMSIGGPEYSEALWDAIKYAFANGVVVVGASGNRNSLVEFPAAFPEVIAVGSINSYNKQSTFSNYGPELDVVGPGEGIISTSRNNQYSTDKGTSFAAPYVSGLAALVKGLKPNFTPNQVEWMIEKSTFDLGLAGWDQQYGYGKINVDNTLQQAGSFPGGIEEPNDTKENAFPIIINNEYQMKFQLPQDQDWFSFHVKNGQTLHLLIESLDSNLIPEFVIYDSSGRFITTAGGSTTIIELPYLFNKTDTYYMKVNEYNGHWSEKDYRLLVQDITSPAIGPYDLNSDSIIDIFDLIILSKSLNQPFNPTYDLNYDGALNNLDLIEIIAKIN